MRRSIVVTIILSALWMGFLYYSYKNGKLCEAYLPQTSSVSPAGTVNVPLDSHWDVLRLNDRDWPDNAKVEICGVVSPLVIPYDKRTRLALVPKGLEECAERSKYLTIQEEPRK